MSEDQVRELEVLYKKRLPLYKSIRKMFDNFIDKMRRNIDPEKKIVRIIDYKSHIKEFDSLRRKAEERNLAADDAFLKIQDIVRGRIVCANLEDVSHLPPETYINLL